MSRPGGIEDDICLSNFPFWNPCHQKLKFYVSHQNQLAKPWPSHISHEVPVIFPLLQITHIFIFKYL